MTDYSSGRCPGCFKQEPFPEQDECPQCGYAPGQDRSPLALPVLTELKGRYVAGRLLGAPGGFGITYLAFDKFKDERVAVKEYLPREVAGRDTDGQSVVPHSSQDREQFEYGMDRFLKEAKTLGEFDHANIVRARDFFEANGTAYLVMEYYEGKTLKAYLKEQPEGQMDPEIATEIMLRVLDGLKEVHSEGYLHRDVKPENIYLTKEGRPILIDFGAARFALGERSRSLSVVITEGYAPYEQYSSQGNQGPHTDVYGVGATLYRMVTGRKPPPATDRVMDDDLEEPWRLNPEVPPGVSQVIVEALAIGDEERISSAESLQRQLRASLQEGEQDRKTHETARQATDFGEETDQGTGFRQADRATGTSPPEVDSDEETDWLSLTFWGGFILFVFVIWAGILSIVPNEDAEVDSGEISRSGGEGQSESVNRVDRNAAPKARTDEASTSEDEAVVIDVLSNDSDPDGDELSIAEVQAVASGRAEALGNGEVRFIPESGYVGTTYLSYVTSDGNGGTDNATVRIGVERDGSKERTATDSDGSDSQSSSSTFEAPGEEITQGGSPETFTEAVMWRKPSADSEMITSIPSGARVRVISSQGEFHEIEYDGKKGYVKSFTLKNVKYQSLSETSKGFGEEINQGRRSETLTEAVMWRKPSADSEMITSIPSGTRVRILSSQDGFYRVKYDGGEGYIRKYTIKDKK